MHARKQRGNVLNSVVVNMHTDFTRVHVDVTSGKPF